jgi:hypothetical protein
MLGECGLDQPVFGVDIGESHCVRYTGSSPLMSLGRSRSRAARSCLF